MGIPADRVAAMPIPIGVLHGSGRCTIEGVSVESPPDQPIVTVMGRRSDEPGHGTVVVVTAMAEGPRQLVGPYAWVVLEHLAGRIDPAVSDAPVRTSTREIASLLAVSKDTVTRALRGLLDAGLIDRVVERDPVTGQFGVATYRPRLDRCGLRVELDRAGSTGATNDVHPARAAASRGESEPKAAEGRATRAPRPRRKATRTDVAQLRLLDDGEVLSQ